MTPSKRRMTGEKKINVVFTPPLSVQKGDQFATACERNTKTNLYDYFFIPHGSAMAHRITDTTYTKLLNQSEPV
jgi:hypothetical protein